MMLRLADALPLVELICAAAEPLTLTMRVVRWAGIELRCKKVCDGVSLLFPLREGEVIGVLHKTVTDWLTGEAPFDKRSSEDEFFVARGRGAPAAGAGVCSGDSCWGSGYGSALERRGRG